jgi:hypothetical protein
MRLERKVCALLLALVGLSVTAGSDAMAMVGPPPMPVSVAVTDGLAVVGRPATPVSYAGVARRTVRRNHY